MKRLLIILFCIPIFLFSQPATYNVTVNTSDVWQANLFFLLGGSPMKPVKIIDPSGTDIFSQTWGLKGWDFKVNYNNKLSYFDRSSKGWFIMDSLQNEVDSVYCQNGYVADNHDFLALPNGNYVLFAYDEQPYAMDTVVQGGDPNAIVEGLIIQELDSNHNLLFEWKSWDHFHVTDNTYISMTSALIPFIHANAIDIDFDGHFLVSCRGLDEITKIHRTTGDIIWRWGGSQNEFTFVNGYPFTHQHSIRSLGANRYILYDNGNHSAQYTGTVNISRAVEYVLDTNLMEAIQVWEFVHPDSLYTPSIGGVQRLPNGNTLIDFGNLQSLNIGSIVTEVDTNNQIVFQLEYANNGNLYRAQKFDWFFYTPPAPTWDCVAGSCIDPGTGMGSYTDSLQCAMNCGLPPAPTWDCIVGSCIDPGTGMGSYTDSLQCAMNCGLPPAPTWDCIVGSCIDPGTGMGSYTDSLQCIFSCHLTDVINLKDVTKVRLIKIQDILGRETPYRRNTLLFYLYDDGTVEKRIMIQ